MCGIYKITNQINGKIYVGKSVHIEQRFTEHKRDSQVPQEQWEVNYRHVKTPFHTAVRKYGIENFNLEILEECEEQQLNKREKYWIAKLNATDRNIGYNVTFGGDGYSCGGGENAPGSKITQAECDLIKEKLRERWSYSDILKLIPSIKYSSTISNINYGKAWRVEGETYPICIDPGHRIWSDEEAMNIKQRYAKGETIMALANELNVNYNTITALVTGKSYTNLPVLEREVDWKRISNNRKLSSEQVLYYRNRFYKDKQSIRSLHESCPIKMTYAAFYNMIKGITYKNLGGLPSQ